MSVSINTTRKAVEIAWDTSGGGGDIDPPDGFPEPPLGIWGGANEPFPEHPMVPPGETEPPDPEEPPTVNPPDPGYNPPVGLPQPPFYPYPVAGAIVDEVIAVRIFAQGQEGDWSNTDIKANDGLAVLTYPLDFAGESYIEVRSALDGKVIDSGTIEVS